MLTIVRGLPQLIVRLVSFLELASLQLTQPAPHAIVLSTASAFTHSKADLIAENALLRQQLIVLHRQVKNPSFTPSDRLGLILLASRVQNWKESLLLFKPDTLLRWHRDGFRRFGKFKSRHRDRRPPLAPETVTLIPRMAQENRLWGAERLRGELLKLGLTVAKHTIQKYITPVRPAKPSSPTWAIFLKNPAKDIWACDFLPVTDLWFRPLYLYFMVELASRRMVHFGVTRSPTDKWVPYLKSRAPAPGNRTADSRRKPSIPEKMRRAKIIAFPVPNGLHHDCRMAA